MSLRPPHVSPRGMWVSKLALRIAQFILAVAIVGCVGSIAATVSLAILPLVVILSPTIPAAIWDVSEGICIIVRRGHRGLHPGANVALDLLIWLGFVGATIALWLLGITAIVAAGFLDTLVGLEDFNRDQPDSSSSLMDDTINNITGRWQALIGLGATLAILHFTTFVIACYETSVRNRSPQIVFVGKPSDEQVLFAGSADVYQFGISKA